MSLEYVLLTLLVLQTLGMCTFKRFETETAVWRGLLKWTIANGGTIALYYAVGGWALLFPLAFGVLGATAHVVICKKEGFHMIYATPREKYYAYRGWTWPPE